MLKERGLTEKDEAAVGLLEEPAEASFTDVEELRGLAVEGRERGYLTFEEIAACLEEVEVTKEQIGDFRAHLVEAGVDIVSSDGRPHNNNGLNDSPAGPEGPAPAKKADAPTTAGPSPTAVVDIDPAELPTTTARAGTSSPDCRMRLSRASRAS